MDEWQVVLDTIAEFPEITVTSMYEATNTIKNSGTWTTSDNRVYTRTWQDVANFRLQSTSPCIDAGTLDSGVTMSDRDFLGRPRIRRQVPDIGAIEWTHRPGWVLEERE